MKFFNFKKREFNSNKKKAFTLPEMMITISVIGIVAALTFPMLVTSYQKKTTLSQLQKVFQDLNAAMKIAVADAKLEDLDYKLSPYKFFKKYMTSVLVVSETTMSELKSRGIKYRQISGAEETALAIMGANASKTHIVNLSNGAQLFLTDIDSTTPSNRTIYLDINGFGMPNTFGKDCYMLVITKKGNNVVFHNTDDGIPVKSDVPRNTLINGPSQHNYQCNGTGRGMWCGALIQQDGWEFKSDYPW